MTRALLACLLFAAPLLGCAASRDDSTTLVSDDALVGGSVLRRLSGDGTTIADDWTAREGDRRYDVVTDGSPLKPWISSAHASGQRSIAFQVPTDTSGHKQRVEYKIARASDADGLHFDNARYSGFDFKLESSPAPFTCSAIFWQAWQGYPWGPPVSLKFESDASSPYRIRLAIRNRAIGPDSSIPDITLWSGELAPNAWHTFLIYLEPRFASDGHIKLWMDGTKVLDWTGSVGYDPHEVDGAYSGLDIKNGIYQPAANNGHTFYFDQLVFASTYESALAAMQ